MCVSLAVTVLAQEGRMQILQCVSECVVMRVMLAQLWNDYQLEWDPTDFGGISVIRILSHKVWKPDIVLFNKLVTTPT